MLNPLNLPATKADLDAYEVEHIFHSWSFQPDHASLRVVTASGLNFTTDDGRERIDFNFWFADHNLGHQDSRVVEAVCDQVRELCPFAPNFANELPAPISRVSFGW